METWKRLQDVGWTMTDASLCGLGQTASQAILSAIELWPKLIDHQGISIMSNQINLTIDGTPVEIQANAT